MSYISYISIVTLFQNIVTTSIVRKVNITDLTALLRINQVRFDKHLFLLHIIPLSPLYGSLFFPNSRRGITWARGRGSAAGGTTDNLAWHEKVTDEQNRAACEGRVKNPASKSTPLSLSFKDVIYCYSSSRLNSGRVTYNKISWRPAARCRVRRSWLKSTSGLESIFVTLDDSNYLGLRSSL